MEKFIYIPVAEVGNQMVSVANVATILEPTATSTTTSILYNTGVTLIITHAADTDFSVMISLQKAIKAALETSWTNVVPVTASFNVAVSSVELAG